ncbi:DNA cytosine methyltransferase [Flectobacillus roseus]
MKHASLFSGIGGFDLVAHQMGWENVFHCEINPFCQQVLQHYWPNAILYDDITTTDFSKHRGQIDVLTGGFPCQPYSVAGKRMGKADERHLWPHMLRAIHEIRPTWVVGENVRGIISWDNGLVFEEVHAQLEAEGYEVQAFVLPAAGVDAPHRRDRVWFVAHAKGQRNDRSKGRESTIRERDVFQAEQGRDQMGTEAQGCDRKWIITNANGCTTRSPRTSIRAGESWSNIAQQSSEWRSQTQQHFGCGDVLWNATNTPNQQSHQYQFKQCEVGQPQQRELGRGTSPNSSIISPHANSIGQPSQEHRQNEPRLTTKKGLSSHWAAFPVESPVCGQDDGFSSRLDRETLLQGRKTRKSTFNYWREESIKAYGNAIVPQVVWRIFEVIEQMTLIKKYNG